MHRKRFAQPTRHLLLNRPSLLSALTAPLFRSLAVVKAAITHLNLECVTMPTISSNSASARFVDRPFSVSARTQSSDSTTSARSASKQPTAQPIFTVPMGFASQIRALQEAQRAQDDRIACLEKENMELKAFQASTQNLLARIATLEQHNMRLATRRRECVGQFRDLRTHHQDASNAFLLRAQDIQPDDLESMLAAYASSMTTVVNHHQHTFGQLRSGSNAMHRRHWSMSPPAPPPTYATGPTPVSYAYPPRYNQVGYCWAHNIPYCCHACGE